MRENSYKEFRQRKHREFGIIAQAQGTLYAQVVSSLIKKIDNIAISIFWETERVCLILFLLISLQKSTHGSFLSRGKDTLAKIAEMTKPISTNINGPRHSRSFLFSTMDKDGDEEEQKKPAVSVLSFYDQT